MTIRQKYETTFKVLYLLLTLLSFNYYFARELIITYFAYFVIAVGIVAGCFRLKNYKDYLNTGVFLLLSFVCSYILGAVNSVEYGYFDNIKAVAWMCVQFFLIFAFSRKTDYAKERKIIFYFFITYTFICSVVSIVMMIRGVQHYDLYEDMYWIPGGFLDNRLWGCYIDPNYGTILSLISILISLYFITDRKGPGIVLKILLAVNICLEFSYVCFSDSRTGMIAIAASGITLSVLGLSHKKGIFKALLIGIVSVALIIGFLYGVKLATSGVKIEIAKAFAAKENLSEEETAVIINQARVGRTEEQIGEGEDITNNRIKIWNNAIEMFKQHPVFGISFRNIREYAYDNIPDTYAEFESMHNFFFDVLVSQGIVGILILLSFMVWVIWTLVKKYLSIKAYREFAFMMAVVAAIFASMLTYSESFYMNTGGAFIFWYVLGSLVNFKEKDETMVEV